jgi:hypothetical protein
MQTAKCRQTNPETAALENVRVCVRFWLRVVTAQFAFYILHLAL